MKFIPFLGLVGAVTVLLVQIPVYQVDIRHCSCNTALQTAFDISLKCKISHKSSIEPIGGHEPCEAVRKTDAATNNQCSVSLTAFPPDQQSGCCGDDLSNSRVIGGRETDIDQYPWLALVEYASSGKMLTLCGGSLISVKYVLTAAHCVTGPVLNGRIPTNIILGDYNKTHGGPDCVADPAGAVDCTEGETRIPIEQIIPHPQYDIKSQSRSNNIALIKMKRTAPYSDFIRPICLPTEDITTKGGLIYLIMAGWGTAYGPSDVKLYVNLPFIPLDQCQAVYKKRSPNLTLGKGQLCAGGEKGKDSCKGDGGMPLMYESDGKYMLAGTASFGSLPCGTEGVPSVYSNVYEYKSWINSNISP